MGFGRRSLTIRSPRGLLLDSYGDVLVTSSSGSTITAIREVIDDAGNSTVETRIIVNAPELQLTHGIAFFGGFLYASGQSTVYRWPYVPGQFSLIDGTTVETVINGIETGGHSTRTLIFDAVGILYVSIGSQDNIDPDSSRARIRRFNLSSQTLPIPFSAGELFADGVRNTVGLAFNSEGVLFGVDNGPDLLNHPEFGPIWDENPGEEMNKFTLPIGTHYGYPYCWSSYILEGYPAGSQFAWPSFDNYNDSYCQDPNKNPPPVLAMPAHSAPLSIEFYKGENCGIDGAFPCSSIGDAFVAFRGSWHTGVSYGYKVSWYPFNNSTQLPTGEVTDVIFAPNAVNSCNTCLRPVGAIFNKRGHLIVAADATNEIYKITYAGNADNAGARSFVAFNLIAFVTFFLALFK
ncbi:hypothetical protein HA402_001101 [Bradysia odoriphaga]|nr:hypothetical protein HA402_001101 [Bradysia odoriphaga]